MTPGEALLYIRCVGNQFVGRAVGQNFTIEEENHEMIRSD